MYILEVMVVLVITGIPFRFLRRRCLYKTNYYSVLVKAAMARGSFCNEGNALWISLVIVWSYRVYFTL